MMFARHNRIWLSKDGWKRAALLHGVHAHTFARWAANNWPVILRRLDADTQADMIALGLPLPPDTASGIKIRIPFTVHLDEIIRSELALNICDTSIALPSQWFHAHADLCKQIKSEQLDMRVYGSLAMQTLTGLPYLTDESDIDLLFTPHNRTELDLGLSLLTQQTRQLPLDGEILFPSGRAISWKEWLQARDVGYTTYVLAKSLRTVALIRAEELLNELPNVFPQQRNKIQHTEMKEP